MTIENQEQEMQEFETENTELENEQEAEAETEQEEAEEESEEQEQENSEEKKSLLKDFRKREREKDKRIRELEAKLSKDNPTDENLELPTKPKLAEFDYDDDAYEKALDNWHSQKHKIESVKQTQQQQLDQQKAEFNNKLQVYNENIPKLNVDRAKFNEAETVAKEVFNLEQLNMVLLYADNPTKLIYALGRDEDVAEELASITDKAKFLVAIAKHEEKIKMKTTKTVPPAERKVNASPNVKAVSADKKLEQLRAKAEQTGNYTELFAYKKTLKGK